MRGETYTINQSKVLKLVEDYQGIKSGILAGNFSANKDTIVKRLRAMENEGLLVNQFKPGGLSRWYTPEYVKKYGFLTASSARNKTSGSWQPEEVEFWRLYCMANRLMAVHT